MKLYAFIFVAFLAGTNGKETTIKAQLRRQVPEYADQASKGADASAPAPPSSAYLRASVQPATVQKAGSVSPQQAQALGLFSQSALRYQGIPQFAFAPQHSAGLAQFGFGGAAPSQYSFGIPQSQYSAAALAPAQYSVNAFGAGSGGQLSSAPQQFSYEAQGGAPAAQPAAIKYAQPAAPAKYNFPAPSPAPVAFQFSPASEVSNFRFQNPTVTYSNLGILTQITPKLAPGVPQTSQVSVAPQAYLGTQQSAAAYSSGAEASAAPAGAASAGKLTYSSPQQYFQSQPQAYEQAASQPQQFSYSSYPHAASQSSYSPIYVPSPSTYSIKRQVYYGDE